jgi:hypothetical protein
MKELAGRLQALDPDAGAALQVIAYFDRLTERRAALESIVRGAALLADAPARLHVTGRGLDLRVTPDGKRNDHAGEPAPQWCGLPVDDASSLWLERPGPASSLEAMVLERAAIAARAALLRMPNRQPGRQELIGLLLDEAAADTDRGFAATRLGLATGEATRVAAALDGRLDILRGPRDQHEVAIAGRRLGIGPAVAALDLAATVRAARTAVRFTADGTATDPGPRLIYVDDLGVLILLAQAVDDEPQRPLPDVDALERAATATPWMLATLDALARNLSLRAAATALSIHHSTLQERAGQAEHHLGWSLHDVSGQLRLAGALMTRRVHRTR